MLVGEGVVILDVTPTPAGILGVAGAKPDVEAIPEAGDAPAAGVILAAAGAGANAEVAAG